MKVERWNETLGEPTEEKMRRYLESNGYSVVKYDYPPGTSFPNHAHAFDKKDVSGRFRIEAEGHEFVLARVTCLRSTPALSATLRSSVAADLEPGCEQGLGNQLRKQLAMLTFPIKSRGDDF